jgi:DNA-directed RNA polymerase subunit RPC12/RpoP
MCDSCPEMGKFVLCNRFFQCNKCGECVASDLGDFLYGIDDDGIAAYECPHCGSINLRG